MSSAVLYWLLIPAAYLWAVFLEWSIHRYLFHGLGRKKGSLFSFHYHEHHRAVRKSNGADASYQGSFLAWNAYGREVCGIALVLVAHIPLAKVSLPAFLVMAGMGWNYHRLHRKSHEDPEWCREQLRWHWEHHMSPHHDANWCVTNEWFDKFMGTRKTWVRKQDRKAG